MHEHCSYLNLCGPRADAPDDRVETPVGDRDRSSGVVCMRGCCGGYESGRDPNGQGLHRDLIGVEVPGREADFHHKGW
jgi:hypothetical protein